MLMMPVDVLIGRYAESQIQPPSKERQEIEQEHVADPAVAGASQGM